MKKLICALYLALVLALPHMVLAERGAVIDDNRQKVGETNYDPVLPMARLKDGSPAIVPIIRNTTPTFDPDVQTLDVQQGYSNGQWVISYTPRNMTSQERKAWFRSKLAGSDTSFIRVIEDLYDTLIAKGVLNATDLPVSARNKINQRKAWRAIIGE